MRVRGYGLRYRKKSSGAGWLFTIGLMLLAIGYVLRSRWMVVFPLVLYPYERMGDLLMIAGLVLICISIADYLYHAQKRRDKRVKYLSP